MMQSKISEGTISTRFDHLIKELGKRYGYYSPFLSNLPEAHFLEKIDQERADHKLEIEELRKALKDVIIKKL